MMKKLLAFVFAAMICFCSIDALADQWLDPEDGWPYAITEKSESGLRSRSGESLNVEINSTYQTDTNLSVVASVVGGAADAYYYSFKLSSYDEITTALWNNGTTYYHYNYIPKYLSTSNQFTYRLAAPGNYKLEVIAYVKNENSYSSVAQWSDRFSVSGQDLIQKRVKELAADIKRQKSTDYDRALLAHDMLIQMGDYDKSYARHTPDGILLDGVGVCESYAKAYYLLLKEMGIPVRYITGTAENSQSSGNHAWNAAYAEEKWFLVDCTWDEEGTVNDPSKSDNPVEMATHYYYGVTSELLGKNHFPEDGQTLPNMNSLDQNYYIHENASVLNKWMNMVRSGEEGIDACLAAGETAFSADSESCTA